VNFAYAKLFAASESMLAHLENDLRARRLWRQDMEECGFDSREAEREEKLRAEYSIIKKLESVIDLARPR
jgi:DNA-binding HxlR family transcriptional regulator